jgi:hypothetical protein
MGAHNPKGDEIRSARIFRGPGDKLFGCNSMRITVGQGTDQSCDCIPLKGGGADARPWNSQCQCHVIELLLYQPSILESLALVADGPARHEKTMHNVDCLHQGPRKQQCYERHPFTPPDAHLVAALVLPPYARRVRQSYEQAGVYPTHPCAGSRKEREG